MHAPLNSSQATSKTTSLVQYLTKKTQFKRSTWSDLQLTIILLILSASLVCAFFSSFLNHTPVNACNMTYMYPKFHQIQHINISHPKYKLFLYREGRKLNNPLSHLEGNPILFIHGNAGSYKQVRSFASESNRKYNTRPVTFRYNDPDDHRKVLTVEPFEQQGKSGRAGFDYFSVEFDEEMSGISGHVLLRQSDYVYECLSVILELYNSGVNTVYSNPSTVLLMGHSMGGIVARSVFLHPKIATHGIPVDTIMTFASPNRVDPFLGDQYLAFLYHDLDNFWGNPELYKNGKVLSNIVISSVAAGRKDELIRPDLTRLGTDYSSIVPSNHSVDSSLMQLVDLSTDHLAILWCNQFVRIVVDSTFALLDPKTHHIIKNQTTRHSILKSKLNAFHTYEDDVDWYFNNAFRLFSQYFAYLGGHAPLSLEFAPLQSLSTENQPFSKIIEPFGEILGIHLRVTGIMTLATAFAYFLILTSYELSTTSNPNHSGVSLLFIHWKKLFFYVIFPFFYVFGIFIGPLPSIETTRTTIPPFAMLLMGLQSLIVFCLFSLLNSLFQMCSKNVYHPSRRNLLLGISLAFSCLDPGIGLFFSLVTGTGNIFSLGAVILWSMSSFSVIVFIKDLFYMTPLGFILRIVKTPFANIANLFFQPFEIINTDSSLLSKWVYFVNDSFTYSMNPFWILYLGLIFASFTEFSFSSESKRKLISFLCFGGGCLTILFFLYDFQPTIIIGFVCSFSMLFINGKKTSGQKPKLQ